MSVQFNLLPSVKLEYIQAQRARTKVTSIAVVVSVVSLAILLINILYVEVIQKKQLSDSLKEINSTVQSIQSQTDITKVLTVQNQLTKLVTLHENKHRTSRVFDYLGALTPSGVNISRLTIDYSKNSLTIDGTGDTAANINKFVDTIKFTNYTLGKNSESKPAFSSVVETNFSLGANQASYTLDAIFDPNLFANNLKDSDGNYVTPTLVVPSKQTTRSSVFSGGQ